MARHGNNSCVFLKFTITLILSSISFDLIVISDASAQNMNNESLTIHTPIIEKFGFSWRFSQYDYDTSNLNEDIESVSCDSNINCSSVLPGLDLALLFESEIPSSPYCILDDVQPFKHCTCGSDRCISYSRDFTTGDVFYYCGPCGFVGSHCSTGCTHRLAECRGNYCECIDNGTFYDMSFCYVAFYGKDTMVTVIIGTTGVMLCCFAFAYGYYKLRNIRRRRGSIYSERSSGAGSRESPFDDIPPPYDDLMDNLPSYQDALTVFNKDSNNGMRDIVLIEDMSSAASIDERDSLHTGIMTFSHCEENFIPQGKNQIHISSLYQNIEQLQTPNVHVTKKLRGSVTVQEQKAFSSQPIGQVLQNAFTIDHI